MLYKACTPVVSSPNWANFIVNCKVVILPKRMDNPDDKGLESSIEMTCKYHVNKQKTFVHRSGQHNVYGRCHVMFYVAPICGAKASACGTGQVKVGNSKTKLYVTWLGIKCKVQTMANPGNYQLGSNYWIKSIIYPYNIFMQIKVIT